ncbi:MAG: ParB/RepB/Spo0J family partition protein [Thaumarchaeota archaeon]|nr:ParB/RepB/Spo0J family partition protein [Nitrososphaerota archaeon]
MLIDLPLDKIETNPFNPRFDFIGLDKLVTSLQTNGQLSPIRVRQSTRNKDKYQLVFGHRRFMAANKLDWKTIRAEVVSASDERMAIESLVENLDRKDLSDYEKGLIFDRIKNEFSLSFAEIGRTIGISRQHVSNYAAMLNLFSSERLSTNPELRDALFKISEHHSRILLTVSDETSRMDLALQTIKDGLTVRDLANIVGRLRSWFPRIDDVQEAENRARSPNKFGREIEDDSNENKFENDPEYTAISLLIHKIFQSASDRNYERYKKIHLFRDGFTMYSAFPPLERLQGKQAISREHEWFYEIAPRFRFKIQDLNIEALDTTAAMSTFTVICFDKENPSHPVMKMVATMVLRKKGREWSVLHEHWTRLDLTPSELEKAERILSY